MDEYDEFGNYIGPDMEEEEDVQIQEEPYVEEQNEKIIDVAIPN